MYKITCCRVGKWEKPNKGLKGQFIKQFNTLSEMAKFMNSCPRDAIWFPNLEAELTKREIRILISKEHSLFMKNKKEK